MTPTPSSPPSTPVAGGQLWILGDPRQAPAVKAGGIAAEIDTARHHRLEIPAAQLTVNRRQVDPDDRRALDLLRGGDPVALATVAPRARLGTHRRRPRDHPAGDGRRRHRRHRPLRRRDQSSPSPSSHGPAEDLADRVRRRLADAGALTGPAISGPGWTTDRRYQAGDRVLLHTRHGDRHSLS